MGVYVDDFVVLFQGDPQKNYHSHQHALNIVEYIFFPNNVKDTFWKELNFIKKLYFGYCHRKTCKKVLG